MKSAMTERGGWMTGRASSSVRSPCREVPERRFSDRTRPVANERTLACVRSISRQRPGYHWRTTRRYTGRVRYNIKCVRSVVESWVSSQRLVLPHGAIYTPPTGQDKCGEVRKHTKGVGTPFWSSPYAKYLVIHLVISVAALQSA